MGHRRGQIQLLGEAYDSIEISCAEIARGTLKSIAEKMRGGRRLRWWLVPITVTGLTWVLVWPAAGRPEVLGGVLHRIGNPRAERSEETADSHFPRSATDAGGYRLTLNSPPQRIASQALVTDHLLLAVVPLERMVALSTLATDKRYSNIVEIAERLPVETTTDPERILRLKPDLILVSSLSRPDYVNLVRAVGVPTFRMETGFSSLQQIEEGLRLVGYLTGEDDRAAEKITWLQQQVRAARRRRPADSPKLRVLGFTHFLFSYGKNSLFGDMVEKLGEINVGAEQGLGAHGQIGSEQIAAWNPDWIITGADPGEEEALRRRLLDDPGIAITTAAKQGQILIVENRHYLTLSHHAVHLMRRMAEAFYP